MGLAPNTCGSELARDRGRSGNINDGWFTAIASKLAPTVGCAGQSPMTHPSDSLETPDLVREAHVFAYRKRAVTRNRK